MTNLQQLSEDLNQLSQSLNAFVSPMTNGVNTLASRIDAAKQSINSNNTQMFGDEAYFHSPEGQKILLNIKSGINLDVIGKLNACVLKDDFYEQWQALDDNSKKEFIYFDKSVYPVLRQKLDVAEFNFMFFEFEDVEVAMIPSPLHEWMSAPDSAKIMFYKLRKAAQGTRYQNFFDNPETIQAEKMGWSSSMREKLVAQYLRNETKNPNPTMCWYDRLDMNYNKHWAFGYTYHFLQEMEDEFNGYQTIQKNIELPLILKKWAGTDMDFEAHKNAIKTFEQSLEGLSEADRRKRMAEHPQVLLDKKIQQGINTDEFMALKTEAKGTSTEAFFDLPMTEKMRTQMPYRRIDYMFVYFREAFSQKVKRPKP